MKLISKKMFNEFKADGKYPGLPNKTMVMIRWMIMIMIACLTCENGRRGSATSFNKDS